MHRLVPALSWRDVAIGLSLAALSALFWKLRLLDPPAAGGDSLNPRGIDLFKEVLPLAQETSRQWLEGSIPLWNPYQAAGRPLLAVPLTAVFYPGSLLYLLLPTPVAIEAISYVHLTAAGIFTYAFARTLEVSRSGAVGSGVALMLSGFCVSTATWHPVGISAIAWLPLALFATEKLLRRPGPMEVALLAFAVAMGLLAGWTQIWVYSMYSVAFYAGTSLLLRDLGDRRQRVRVSVALAVAVTLGIGLTAIQLLPSNELRLSSVRSSGVSLSLAMPDGFLSISQLLERLVSGQLPTDLFGWPMVYIGIAPWILLPVAALATHRRAQTLCFGIMCALGLAVTVSESIVETIRWLPTISSFRFQSRVLVISTFSAAILFGFAIDTLARGMPRNRAWLLGGTVVLIALALQVTVPFGPRGSVLLWASAALALVGLFATRSALRVAASSAIVALLALDLFTAPVDEKRRPIHVPSIVEGARGVYDYVREHQEYGRTLMATTHPWDLEIIRLRTTGERIYALTDYSQLTTERTAQFFDRAFGRADDPSTTGGYFRISPESPNLRMLDLLSFRFLVGRSSPAVKLLSSLNQDGPSWRPVYRESGPNPIWVFEHPRPLPRAYVSFRAVRARDGDEALDAISAPDFKPRQTVVVEGLATDLFSAAQAIQPAKITLFSPDEVVVEVDTTAPGILVLTDTYYPGWRAEVAGEEVEIVRANYLLRGIELPAGNHQVTFRYAPDSLSAGAAVSVTSLLMLFAGLFVKRFRSPVRDARDGMTDSGGCP